MYRLWTPLLIVAQCLAIDPVTLQGVRATRMAEMEIVKGQRAECERLNRSGGFRPWNKDMDKLQASQMWALKVPNRDPPHPKTENVKMAFLIFADDRLENEEIWVHWMDQAREAELEFKVYINNRSALTRLENRFGAGEDNNSLFQEHVFPDGLPTARCKHWDAQMNMMNKALLDPRVTHLVVLSSDSVPVKPMTWMYDQAHNDPLSRFCVDDYWRDPWPRAETWSVLRRDDAMFFLDNKDFAEKNFRRGCEDQLGWYFPLRVRWDNFGNRTPLKRECIMFANWKDGHDTCQGQWAKSVDSCDCKALRQPQSNSTPADYWEPVAYHDVNERALEDLVRSPFWFARRFTEGAVPQKLKSVLDIDLSKPRQPTQPRRRFKLFR